MKKFVWFLTILFTVLLIGCGEGTNTETDPASESTPFPAAETPASADTPDDYDVVSVPKTEWIVSVEEGEPEINALSQMTSLRLLDLTALEYTSSETIAAFSSVLPEGCRILWNQRLTDGDFRSDSTKLTLPNATEEDVNLLAAFSNLTEVDFSGSTAYEAIAAFATAHPELAVRYTFSSDGFTLTNADEAVSVPAGADAGKLTDAISYFPNLKNVDLRASGWTEEETDVFVSANSNLQVDRIVTIGETAFDSDTDALNLHDLTGWSADALIRKLRAFPHLKAVGLPSDWTDADIETVKSTFPDVRVAAKFQMFGREIDGAAEVVDLSGSAVSDSSEVEELLLNMPFVKKVDLCNTKLTDEQMIALAEAHPEIRFVWIISIGPHKLRTDAVGFSTKNPSKYTSSKASDEYNKKVKTTKRLYEGDIEMLKYCTDLEALDLGHNYLTDSDLTVIAGLTKLKVLILADNKITDISALTTLKDLEYIELFMNKIPDLSPLADLPGLIDVNVCNVGASDLTPLFELTGVKRLWYAMNPFSRDQAAALKEALKDCVCNYTTRDETGDGWRDDPRYRWMRSYFD